MFQPLMEFISSTISLFEPLQESIIPILIIGAFVIGGYVIKIFIEQYAIKIAEKTKTRIDDIILAAIRTPIFVLLVLGGLEVSLRYVALPPQIAGWIHSSIFLLMGIIGIFTTIRILTGLVDYYGIKYPELADLTPILSRIIRIAVWFIGLMIVLSWVGISISPLLLSFGVGGLAVGLALRGTLENFFSGLQIMMERALKHGDYIELESGESGYIDDIGWRTTKIRELQNNEIVIPNSKLANKIVVNYDSPEQKMRIPLEVGVSYDSDLRKVEEVTIDVAKKVLKEVEGGAEDFEPIIRYREFGDSSINFKVILQVKRYIDKYPVITEFIKVLNERYKQEGIEIPFPIRTIEWGKQMGSQKIVEERE